MFGSLGISSSLKKVTCPAASIALDAGHIGVYYYADFRQSQQNMLLSLGTFRLVLLWELLDELLCWSAEVIDGLTPFPQRITPTKIPAPPVFLREQQQIEWLAARTVSPGLSSPRLSSPRISDSSLATGPHSDRGTVVLQNTPPEVSFTESESRPGNRGYVLKPGIKLGVMISPFEILLPTEPIRVPFRDRKAGEEKTLKAGQSSSRGSGRFGLATVGKPTTSEKKRVPPWRKLSSILKHENEDWSVKLPNCLVMKAAVELKAVIFFYVPDSSITIEEVEVTPLLLDATSMKPITRTEPSLAATSRRSVGLSMDADFETKPSMLRQFVDFAEDEDIPSEELNYHWLSGGNDGVFTEVEQYMLDHQDPLLALLCPCCIKFGVTVSQVRFFHHYSFLPSSIHNSSHSSSQHISFIFYSDKCNHRIICCIHIIISLQLMIATAIPEASTPLCRSKVNWDSTARSNTALLFPLRFEVDSDIFLPSARCVYERMHGITPEVCHLDAIFRFLCRSIHLLILCCSFSFINRYTFSHRQAANIIRRARGLFVSKYPEGIEGSVHIEPVVLNVDSDSCIVLYQLVSILDRFSCYAAEKFPTKVFGESSSSVQPMAFDRDVDAELERAEVDWTPTEKEVFGLNFIRTLNVEVGVAVDLIRIRFWDTFGIQRRCCLTIDVENSAIAMKISPERSPLPHMEDYWWNAFNSPHAVFYCSFLAKMIDEPFDIDRLDNPFARRKRKAKTLVSRMWASTTQTVRLGVHRVGSLFKRRKSEETKEQEGLDEEVAAEQEEHEHEILTQRKPSGEEALEAVKFFSLKEAEGLAKARPPWLFIKGGFAMNAEYLNRYEKTNYAMIEPFTFDMYGMKASPDQPTSLSIEGSWINLNINVPLIDVILVYAFSIVGCGIQRRERLHLDVISKFFKNRRIEEGGGANETPFLHHSQSNEKSVAPSVRRALSDTETVVADAHTTPAPTVSAMIGSGIEEYRIGKLHFFIRPNRRFDILECLSDKMNLSLLGDAIISKSSSFMTPAAGFSGEQYRAIDNRE